MLVPAWEPVTAKMSRLIDKLRPSSGARAMDWQSIFGSMSYNGIAYDLMNNTSYGPQQKIRYTNRQTPNSNGIVFACVQHRASLLSQARFVYQRMDALPRPTLADVIRWDERLRPLEHPEILLQGIEVDVATTGNAYAVLDQGTFKLLRPEFMTIVLGSRTTADLPGDAWDAEVIGYIYEPGSAPAEIFLPSEIAHFKPYTDPENRWLGASYLRPVVLDITTDNQTRQFTRNYYENSATPNVIVKFPIEVTKATVEVFADLFNSQHAGVSNAFKTAFLGAGADPVVVGTSMKDLDQLATTRMLHASVCAAARVPPVIVGAIPGLETATYANYQAAFRSFSDLTIRPFWQHIVNQISHLLPLMPEHRLAYDVRHVSAMQQDAKDDSMVLQQQAITIRTLTDGGFVADSVVKAVSSGDLTSLVHTGMLPVQMQVPGQQEQPAKQNGQKEGVPG